MVNKGFTIEEIDNKIHNCLEMQNLLPKSIIADEDKERGKREVYELGTVAMIRGNNNSTFCYLQFRNTIKIISLILLSMI